MASDNFDRAGGAARHPDVIAPPPPPKSKEAPTKRVPPTRYVHPAKRKEGQA